MQNTIPITKKEKERKKDEEKRKESVLNDMRLKSIINAIMDPIKY